MEKLKQFKKLGEPDPRYYAFRTFDEELHDYLPITAREIYDAVSSIRLHEGVPEPIRSSFEIARNLYAYSWFYYPFNSEAGFLAIRTTEQALKLSLGIKKKRMGLKMLAQRAIDEGLLHSDKFTKPSTPRGLLVAIEEITGRQQRPESEFPLEELPEMLSGMRNSPAHGEASIHPMGSMMLRLSAETINQLFNDPEDRR